MKFGVVVFPGSNCERDMADAVRLYLKEELCFLWHDNAHLPTGLDAILLPGGFSYGDYLRTGALARFSPVMASVRAFADKGGPVLGVCNGFQILTEAGLLPGALMKNASLRFQCGQVSLTVENNRTPFTGKYETGQTIQLPIAHAEGNYYADRDTIAQIEDRHQVVLRYQEDVNGSINRIAGICNEKGNVVGMMPHPERNLWPDTIAENAHWSGEGRALFDSIVQARMVLA